MVFNCTNFHKKLFYLFILTLLFTNVYAQINVKVQVISVSSSLDDCDYGVNIPFIGIVGDSGSDPLLSWSGGMVNNNCYAMPECGNTGSPAGCLGLNTIDVRNESLYLYDENFACPLNFPLTVSWNFEGRENDSPLNCVFGVPGTTQGAIAASADNVVIPAVANTFTQTYTTTTTSGCTGGFIYTVEVRVTGIFPPPIPNEICNAAQIPVDGQFHNYAWCGGYSNEMGEFSMTSPGWLSDAYGSGWLYFTAPASGSVSITTSGVQTTLGTAFIVYHAADGAGCSVAGAPGHGVSASGVTLKRKFQYLSSYDDADDDILLINPQAKADIDMNSCSNIFSDGHDLVAGETYYIQITTDRAADIGTIGIKISDLGGNGSNLSDIPCQAPNAGVLTTVNWNHTNSYGCSTSYEFTGNSNGTSAYNYLDPAGGSNNVNQSSWVSFVAPTSGAAFAETNVSLFGENNALYTYDNRFAPGRPSDYSCANLAQTSYSGSSAIFGGNAQFTARCLEPGYNYYVVGDPATVNLNLSSTVDFTLRDAGNNAPANDILCLAVQNPAFSVPVQLLNQPAPAAVLGDNTNACIERLAGEPGFLNGADKTVWHYFTAPPSGVVNITVTAGTIGQVAFATYHALNGATCYGGLAPATFTNDGTPSTPRLQALGTANGSGAVVSQICCLKPGDRYFIEVDGGTTISEGTYDVRIQEVEVQGGATQYVDADGDTYNASSPAPALLCANESINVSSLNAILPAGGCLEEGYLLHNSANPTQPYTMTVYQQATPTNHFFVNNGTAPYNQLIYVSAMADNGANWGQRCPSARIKDAIPVVFLAPITFGTPTVSACGAVSLTVSGGLPQYDNSLFNYTISPSNQVTPIASGTVASGGTISFNGLQVGNYTVLVSDGEDCAKSKTINIPSIAFATASIAGASSFCINVPANLTATGGGSYNWTQPNGATATGSPLAATQGGVYTVTVTNAAGCTATATHFINALPAAPPTTIALVAPLCTVGNAQLAAGAGYSSYVWSNTTTTEIISVASAGVYTVTATNSAGCTTTASINVPANVNPNAPTITGALLICGNTFTTLDAGASFASYSWSNTQNTPQINVTAAGIYTATVTNTAGCTATASASVTASALPAVPTISQLNPLCSNSATVISAQAGYTSYAWNTAAITATLPIAVGSAGVYTVTVGNVAGCTSTASINVPQFAAPTVPVLMQQDSLCGNANGTLNATGIGYTAYAWNTGATIPTIATSAAGAYTVTVTNANGCQNTNSIVVTAQAAPATATIAQTGVLCSNNGVTLTANTATSTVFYQWNTGATTQTNMVAAGVSGTFSVTISTAAGCTTTASITVNSQQAPTQPLITIDRNLCSNSSGLISVVPNPALTFTWSGTSITNIQTVATSGVYTITVTNAAGCTNSATVGITSYQAPNPPSISINRAFCTNQAAILTAYSPNNPTYFWSNVGSTPSIPITHPGVYTVTVTNGFGCKNSRSYTVVELTPPNTPIIAQAGVLCSNNGVNLTASTTTVGNMMFAWNTGANTPTIAVPANTTSIYTVTITTIPGCTNSTQISVTAIQAPPPPLINVANSLCTNSSGLLSVPTGFTYNWSGGSVANTQPVAIGNAGIYTVTITAATGCTNSSTIAVSAISPPAAPAITVSSLFCTGGTATITAASGYATYDWGGGNTSPVQTIATNGTYTVTVTNIAGCSTIGTINAVANQLPTPPTITQNAPLCANKSTMLTANSGYIAYDWGLALGQSVSIVSAGVYTVTVTDAIGCTNTGSTTVVTAPQPVVALQGNPYFCVNGQTTLMTTMPFATYAWSDNSSTQAVTVWLAGDYSVTVTDANGCTATLSVTVTERSLPNVSAGNHQAIYIGESATLNASGATSYVWTPTSAFTNPTNPTQVVAPTETTRYFVLGTDSYGCEKMDSVEVKVYDYLECLKVDEGISPNGDGKNDVWFIPCIMNFENTLEVYNRWGELLYSAVNYTQDWGGVSKGQDLPDGTYYYVIKIKTNNPRKLYKGTITILR